MAQRTEVSGVTKGGNEIPLEIALTKTFIDGRMVISAQIRDISERIRSEKALLGSEERFHALFNHALEAMCLLDITGRVLEINRAALELLPENAPEITAQVDQKFWELNWWHQNTASESLTAAIENLKVLTSKAAEGEIIRQQVQLTTQEGRKYHLDFSLLPLRGTDGGIEFLLAEGRDLSHLSLGQ